MIRHRGTKTSISCFLRYSLRSATCLLLSSSSSMERGSELWLFSFFFDANRYNQCLVQIDLVDTNAEETEVYLVQ